METSPSNSQVRGIIWAIALSAMATGVGLPLYHLLGLANTNVLMLYLVVVLWIASQYTRGAAIMASVLGVALFDFFFVPPYRRFTVQDPQYVVTFAAMLVTALVISALTSRIRAQADAARERERRTAALSAEREMLAEQARQAWERVEVEFLRNTLLSGVSHELRTPLAAITLAGGTLLENENKLRPEVMHELFDTIVYEAERMERLITNLLDMTRMESGGLVLKKEWQPLHEVVGSALHRLDRRLNGREVKIGLASDLPMVQIDAIAIETVLANLIDNAIEYTPPGSPIEIAARVADKEMTILVADRGPGLPAGTEGRIFEKFFRIRPDPPAGSPTRRGIGLGLAIARGIVEAHGGRISAENRPEGGAIFRFTLPMTEIPPQIDATQ